MSYINKKSDPVVNLKLTDIGREQLSEGELNFTYFSVGDGEMDYFTNTYSSLKILGPKDDQPDLTYPVPANKNDPNSIINLISELRSRPTILNNTAKDRGFFSGNTIDTDLTIASALKIKPNKFDGNRDLELNIDNDTIVNNATGLTVGDYVFLKINDPRNNNDLSYYSIDPTPHPTVWYQIENITDTLNDTGITLTVDREIPKFDTLSGATSSGDSIAYIYPGGKAIDDYYDEVNKIAYWDESVLNFSQTGQVNNKDVPVWNMNIVYKEDVIGIDPLVHKSFDESLGNDYRGLFHYLFYTENQRDITKLGVIHYTNNTINNFYGEGFYKNTLKLHIPYLMWHNTSDSTTIGETFKCGDEIKQLNGNIDYYDLIDKNNLQVGKVFPNLKIVVIEHAELLAALSHKSNRNWTLPKPELSIVEAGFCDNVANNGILQNEGEEICVTYLLANSKSFTTGIQCENYSRIGITTGDTAKDVIVRLPNNSFPYMDTDLNGFNAEDIYILYQVVNENELPESDSWNYFLATNLIGSDGCFLSAPTINENFQLYSETHIANGSSDYLYNLDHDPIGEVLVSINGVLQKEAYNTGYICDYESIDDNFKSISSKNIIGTYYFDEPNNQVTFEYTGTSQFNPSGFTSGLKQGDVIQFHYLYGDTVASQTLFQTIVVPQDLQNQTTGEIYYQNGNVYIDLRADPHCGAVYVFYNGQTLSSNDVGGASDNYDVEEQNQRIKLNFVPPQGAIINLIYLNKTSSGGTGSALKIDSSNLTSTNFVIDDYVNNNIALTDYALDTFMNLAQNNNDEKLTFGDENFFFGNLSTKIKATVYSSNINLRILPGKFVESNNPTFNNRQHTVAFTSLGIYDNARNLVAVGKFSEPIQRRLNSETLIINANIDF